MLTVNVANGLMVENAPYLGKSYFDILYPKPESTETAEEIIERISNKLEGLKD